MIKRINFTKVVASGNDFVVIDNRKPLNHSSRALSLLAKQICSRKYGVGADGLLLLEKSRKTDVKMRIFNPDGSEPRMCGNGTRCAALYVARSKIKIETKAGIIEARLNKGSDEVKIKMTQPRDIKSDLLITIARRFLKVNFINTGVPHTVIFSEGLDCIDVAGIGRQVRFYKRFLPAGTNVDFVEVIDDNNIKLRTYERGVEDETLACGTGAVAAALIYALRYPKFAMQKINVNTRGGEILRVEFDRTDGKFKDVWLEGKARVVYSGVYYV